MTKKHGFSIWNKLSGATDREEERTEQRSFDANIAASNAAAQGHIADAEGYKAVRSGNERAISFYSASKCGIAAATTLAVFGVSLITAGFFFSEKKDGITKTEIATTSAGAALLLLALIIVCCSFKKNSREEVNVEMAHLVNPHL